MRIFSGIFALLCRLRRIFVLGLCAALTAVLCTGCGEGQLNSFTWEVEAVPANLDPQTAQESADVIAVTHLYSGLYRLGSDGKPVADCAESCDLSADGLTYTFTLKQGITYLAARGKASGVTLTADDFVFGLQRVFSPETASPYASALGNIEGAEAIAAGRAEAASLGVSAPDDRTLVIRLSQPDENFLSKLCLPGAMPCHREFFESSKGTYGLSADSTLGNGPFYLYNWTTGGLFLRRSGSSSQVNSLRLVASSTVNSSSSSSSSSQSSGSGSASGSESLGPAVLTALQKVEDGKVDAALSDEASGGGLTDLPYTASTWVLVYNCSMPGLSDTQVRQGLSASAAQLSLALEMPYTAAEGLIPPEVQVNGTSYRQSAGSQLFTSDDPAALYKAGLAEAGLEKLSGVSVLVPSGLPAQLFGQLNQQWQKQLSAFFTVQEKSSEEILQAVQNGQFQIALLPLSPTENDPLSLLSALAGGAYCQWQDADFAAACADEAQNFTLAGRAARVARLENQLLTASPLTPLFYQTQYLVVNPAFSGLVFEPFGPVLDLTGALKK